MHFSFKIIFYVIFLINSILCYDPPKRAGHDSVIINNRLLVLAGEKNQSSYTYELFYLDLSMSFDNTNLPWTLIPDGNLPINNRFSTAIVGLDNSTIFQIGGFIINKDTLDYDFSKQVYTYDYSTSKWATPSIIGDNVPPRQQIRGVIDNSGIIYIFGGVNATNLTALTGTRYNDMNTLDTSSLTWRTLSISENLPFPCCDYSASLLPNGIIVYIGGQEDSGLTYYVLVKMKSIKLFDTKKLEWSSMNATGDDVDSRWLFSSVLTSDGYIIIFGGCSYYYFSVSPNLAILDTNKSPYEWSIPSNSKVNSPPFIYGHSSNLYFNYMIILFGYNADDQIYNSQVYIYDTTSNKWVTSFNPPVSTTTSTSTSISTRTSSSTSTRTSTHTSANTLTTSTKKSSKGLAIGLGLGISAVVVISGIFIIIFISRRKKRILRISGNQ
ncbi:hypothetical protein Glove_51g86 [Diversispora epigaea]|uniref:Galactose oxidase n=1 Tax=Diversispora epigaea TaxID=1348612 RepID=A0A397JGX6_9GLOM|nr:hypothetical protein Glove_51g86 [Diversispora epigaea]